jgi:hypothetical protein
LLKTDIYIYIFKKKCKGIKGKIRKKRGNVCAGRTRRDYDAESERKKTVEEFYRVNHGKQTLELVSRMRGEYGRLDKTEMSVWECIELLNEFIDDSDPDLDMPQIEHLLQTAEAIRKDFPDEDWLHLTGLIHGTTYCTRLSRHLGPKWSFKFTV